MTIIRKLLALAVISFSFTSVLMVMPPAAAAESRRVSAWLPYWDHARGLDAIGSDGDQFGEVLPFWYRLTESGTVAAYPNAGSSTVRDAVRAAGASILPTISNEFDRARVATIIADPARRAAHVSALVSLIRTEGYDGLDVDYEGLAATDRTAFTTFVRELATGMHSAGKTLSITVHPKTSEPGSWDGPQAQDYAAIGAAADRVRIMAYDYHWSTSTAGAISPAPWVDSVAKFAASVIPASKVHLGLPLYGYDWVGSKGTGVTYSQVRSLIATYSPTVQWSSADEEPWFTYRDGSGVTHTVWFADARSTEVRLASVTRYGLGGVVFWRLGHEDAGVWSATRRQLGSAPSQPPADTTPPSVVITSPKPNARVSVPSQRVVYAASDNVGVVRSELYVDGVIVYSDTTGRGDFTVQTSAWSRGKHRLTVRVLDAAGNVAVANASVRKF